MGLAIVLDARAADGVPRPLTLIVPQRAKASSVWGGKCPARGFRRCGFGPDPRPFSHGCRQAERAVVVRAG